MLISIFLFVVSFAIPSNAYAQQHAEIETQQHVITDITLRPGVTTDITLTQYQRVKQGTCTQVGVAVHGYSHTAATWELFAEKYLAQGEVCAVYAIDLPGHGASGLPVGMVFGDMVLEDYVTTVQAVLTHLQEQKIHTRTIVAHSQGALVTQMLQQRLLDHGTNLRDAYAVKEVVFLAPAQPLEQSWYFVDSGIATTLLSTFIGFDSTLGTIVGLPGVAFPQFFFTKLSNTVATDAPHPLVFDAQGYASVEPLYSSLQLSGTTPFIRPSIDSGIFGKKHNTKLTVVGYAQDTVVLSHEASSLYVYLTGDIKQKRMFTVENENAVHDAYISQPETTVSVIR